MSETEKTSQESSVEVKAVLRQKDEKLSSMEFYADDPDSDSYKFLEALFNGKIAMSPDDKILTMEKVAGGPVSNHFEITFISKS